MFMKQMRGSAKYVMGILTVAFVAWLVLSGINDIRSGGGGNQLNPVVGRVAGRDIKYSDWNAFLQNQLTVARQSDRSLTEEEVRVVTDRAWESLISSTLLQSELDRLGVEITDSEIREAFLNQPPPELLSHPAFQTDGQFDIEKYRRFFTDPATDENTLLQIESYYRSLLPREKLQRLVQGGTYVSEEDAWQFFRDTNETARVRFVRIDPTSTVPDSAVTVAKAEIQAYYNEHEDDFKVPATARTNMVSLTLRPTSADTMAAHERAEGLRERIAGGEDFAKVASAESADAASAANGGDMGRQARSDLDPALADAAFAARIGKPTAPVETSFGFHILQVDKRWGDSVALRQIFVPIEVSGATEDSVFSVLDDLEEVALRTNLVTAADSLGIPVHTDVTLSDDVDFIPGAGALGVAPDWALDPSTEIGELSQFFENATGFHVFELLGRQEGRIAALDEVEPSIRQVLMARKKKEQAAKIAEKITSAIASGASLDEAAGRLGWTVQESETFRRGDFVPGLGQGTEAIGAAFGTPIGGVSRVVDAGDAVAVLQVIERQAATREAFDKVKTALLGQLEGERTQEYVQHWLRALREDATVEDDRARLQQTATTF